MLHLLDAAPPDGSDPVANYQTIRAELANFSPVLAEKPEVVALNKIELIPDGERSSVIERIAGALGFPKGEQPLAVSGATGEGVREMLEAVLEPSSGIARITNRGQSFEFGLE